MVKKNGKNGDMDETNVLQEGAETRSDPSSLAGQERKLILDVLEECLWVQKVAAVKLGISPRSLNYKINKFGITHPHWRRNS
jgi:transcriptional regulator with GAF, ATPase, and Fis domain